MAEDDPELLVGLWFVGSALALWLEGYRWWTTLLGALAAATALAIGLAVVRHVLAPTRGSLDGNPERKDGDG